MSLPLYYIDGQAVAVGEAVRAGTSLTEDDDDLWIRDTIPGPDVVRTARNLARNYAVLPLCADKTPVCEGGYMLATRDEAEIACSEWWQEAALIGVALGEVNDLSVLDVDLQHPEARAWWHKYADKLPRTRLYRTKRGGVHAWFRYCPGLGRAIGRPVKGVDALGEGGHVVAWFATGQPCLDNAPRAPWPDWLLREIRPPQPKHAPRQITEPMSDDRAIEGILAFMREAPEGEWNSRLFWSACRLRERGLDMKAAQRLLLDAAQPWNEAEARKARSTISSAWRR